MDKEILKLYSFLLDLRPPTGFSLTPPPRPACPVLPSGSVCTRQSWLTVVRPRWAPVVPCTGPLHVLVPLQLLPLSQAWLRCQVSEQPLSHCPARPLAFLQSSAQRQCGLECAYFLFNVQFLHRMLGHRSSEAVLRAVFPALGLCPAEHCSVSERKDVPASPAALSQGLRAGACGLSWATFGLDVPRLLH